MPPAVGFRATLERDVTSSSRYDVIRPFKVDSAAQRAGTQASERRAQRLDAGAKRDGAGARAPQPVAFDPPSTHFNRRDMMTAHQSAGH